MHHLQVFNLCLVTICYDNGRLDLRANVPDLFDKKGNVFCCPIGHKHLGNQNADTLWLWQLGGIVLNTPKRVPIIPHALYSTLKALGCQSGTFPWFNIPSFPLGHWQNSSILLQVPRTPRLLPS